MTYKQIQAAHEVRMWIKEVIIPIGGLAILVSANPEARKAVGDGFRAVKQSVKSKFKKKDEMES